MTNIVDLITEYKEEGMESFISRPDLLEIITDIKSRVDALSSSDRQAANDFLQEIDSYITQQIEQLKSDVEQGKLSVSRVQANSQACLAYLDTARKGITKRNGK